MAIIDDFEDIARRMKGGDAPRPAREVSKSPLGKRVYVKGNFEAEEFINPGEGQCVNCDPVPVDLDEPYPPTDLGGHLPTPPLAPAPQGASPRRKW